MNTRPNLNKQIQHLVQSWGKYKNPKELEKDVKSLLDNVVKRTRNKFEFSLNEQLKRSDRHFGYEVARYPYWIKGIYYPDWVIFKDKDRKRIDFLIEAKGYFRPESKRKLVAVKKYHPDVDIRIVFYRRRERDIKWAERHGFKYAIGKIPKEWLK